MKLTISTSDVIMTGRFKKNLKSCIRRACLRHNVKIPKVAELIEADVLPINSSKYEKRVIWSFDDKKIYFLCEDIEKEKFLEFKELKKSSKQTWLQNMAMAVTFRQLTTANNVNCMQVLTA